MIRRYLALVLTFGVLEMRGIPLQRTSSDRLTASVVVDGKVAAMQLDTGAAISVLDTAFARAAGLKISGAGKIYAPHSVVESGLTRATVEFSGLRERRVRFHIVALRNIDRGLVAEGDAIDGILGADLLHKISGTLRIRPQELTNGVPADEEHGGIDAIALNYKRGLGYTGMVRFGRIEARALIDTGAVTTRITKALAARLAADLKIDEEGNTYAVLESVSFGSLNLHRVPVLVIERNPGGDEYPLMDSVAAYVGLDLLRAIDAEIDLRNPRLRFR